MSEDEDVYEFDTCPDCDDEGFIVAGCIEDTCCCSDPELDHEWIPCPRCKHPGNMVAADILEGSVDHLADAQRALDAEREKVAKLEKIQAIDLKNNNEYREQLATLQAQLRQVEEALQERKEFIADCDTALDRIQAPRTNEGQEELVSTWRRIELLGKLLYQYRQELERSAPTLRAENARLREVLEAIEDGPGTNGYCTQYERYMVELAQAALQPERGKP